MLSCLLVPPNICVGRVRAILLEGWLWHETHTVGLRPTWCSWLGAPGAGLSSPPWIGVLTVRIKSSWVVGQNWPGRCQVLFRKAFLAFCWHSGMVDTSVLILVCAEDIWLPQKEMSISTSRICLLTEVLDRMDVQCIWLSIRLWLLSHSGLHSSHLPLFLLLLTFFLPSITLWCGSDG